MADSSLRKIQDIKLYLFSLVIAVLFWFQVHGQGVSTLSMDVSLQVQGLADDLVLVNDLPDHVKITVSGLQSRLKVLNEKNLYITLSAKGILEPGVVDRPIETDAIRLPPGLVIDKVQPDRLQLQIDRLDKQTVKVIADFDLPQDWYVENVAVSPAEVVLTGPEVWLNSLTSLKTEALRLKLESGLFELPVAVVIPTERAVKLEQKNAKFIVSGYLRLRAPESHAQDYLLNNEETP